MTPEAFGLQAAVTGSNLPEEWQALIASQASLLAELVSRIETTVATLRRQQTPAAPGQALASLFQSSPCPMSYKQETRGEEGFCSAPLCVRALVAQ
jgi:hypothetical protein